MLAQGIKLQLEELYLPESRKSRHAVISISGFLSENSDLAHDWQYLIAFCKEKGLPLYSLRWESKDTTVIESVAKNNA